MMEEKTVKNFHETIRPDSIEVVRNSRGFSITCKHYMDLNTDAIAAIARLKSTLAELNKAFPQQVEVKE